MKQAAERLKQAVSAGVFLTDEPMSRHTTFRTGGPADIYIEPSCAEELKQVLEYLHGKKTWRIPSLEMAATFWWATRATGAC